MAKRQIDVEPNLPPEIREEDLQDVAIAVAWPKLDTPDGSVDREEKIEHGPELDIVRKYLDEASALPVLNREEERALFQLYVKKRNPDVREKLIRHNLLLVTSVAKKYRNHGLDFLDLVQEGNLGLMTAIDKFEPERGLKFSTYAVWWIRQGIRRAISNIGKTIRIPVHRTEQMTRALQFRNQFFKSHGRNPEEVELASLLDVSVASLRAIWGAQRTVDVASLAEPISPYQGREDITLGDSIGDSRSATASTKIEAKMELRAALRELDKLKKKILRKSSSRDLLIFLCHYGLDDNSFESKTLEVVGRKFGKSKQRIKQIEDVILRRLRTNQKKMREIANRLRILSELVAEPPQEVEVMSGKNEG